MTNHDSTVKNLDKRIKEEKVVFVDQFGKFHKVFNNSETEEVLREMPYHIPTKQPAKVNMNRAYFDDEFKKEVKDYLVPDISVMKNNQYTYWLEAVKTHPCSDNKMSYITNFDFPTIEFSIYDYSHREKRRVVPCFDISKVSEEEYDIIKQYYKLRNKSDSDALHEAVLDIFMGNHVYKIKALQKLLQYETEEKKVIKPQKEKVIISTQTTEQKKDTKKDAKTKLDELCVKPLKILDEIMTVAIPEIEKGRSLDAVKLVEKCLEDKDYDDELKLAITKKIRYKIRTTYKLSVLALSSPHYEDATIEKFNMKRRDSVISKETSAQILEFNNEIINK